MIRIACTRCGRVLKHASATGMGPKCAAAVLGVRRQRRSKPQPQRDARTLDLFEQGAA